MHRPRLSLFLVLLLVAGAWAVAWSADAERRLVRVRLTPTLTAEALIAAGLDVVWIKGDEARILEKLGDRARLVQLGAAPEVLDENPGRTMALRTRDELATRPAPPARRVKSAVEPDGVFRFHTLPPFGAGTMGGFWTTSEIKMKLDELVANDAHDVVADKLDTLGYSYKGRPIWGLKIGKTVPGPDTRPLVFLNALTHAREPQGMQALLYFIDDLVARISSDSFATSILQNRLLYIVPLVNPDGYAINEDTFFSSGGRTFGLWRKNARDNNLNRIFDNDSDGVDINRNFAYQWGGGGASASYTAETYRGPSPASEPETRIQQDLVAALQPVTGLSFHSYSDLMIYPWGYTTTPPLDAAAFQEWSDELTRDNGYISGQAPNVLYPVSGEFNDWCYGDTLAKPRMYSWTPEVGSDADDFWPPPSRILPLAQENLRACYVVAAIAGPYVQEDGVTIVQGSLNAGQLSHLAVRARNLGITGTAGPGLVGKLTALVPGVRVLRASASYPTLGSRQSGDPLGTFLVSVDDTVTAGRLIRFEIRFTDPAGLYSRDTLAIPAGTPTLVASDDASAGLGKWIPASWGIVTADLDHPSAYFADSPFGAYPSNADNRMLLVQPLDLSRGVHAYALFDSRWEMEPDHDGAYLEASLTGGTYTPVPSTGTTRGSGLSSEQPAGASLFAGSQHTWKREIADLSAFTGPGRTAVRLRLRMRTDGGNSNGKLFDGFNFDSLRIVLYDPAAQPAIRHPQRVLTLEPHDSEGESPLIFQLASPVPNPARVLTRFSFALPRAGAARLEVLDIHGRRVRLLASGTVAAGRHACGWDLSDERGRPVAPGVYLTRLSSEEGEVTRRVVAIR